MITYRVRLDVPRELVLFVSRLLARRKEIGTRKNTRSLGCYRQALFVLAWYRDKADIPRLGVGAAWRARASALAGHGRELGRARVVARPSAQRMAGPPAPSP